MDLSANIANMTTSLSTACAHSEESLVSTANATGSQSRGEVQRQQLKKRRHSFFVPRQRSRSIVSQIIEGEEGLMLKVRLTLPFAVSPLKMRDD
jgi:hypothetical protein